MNVIRLISNNNYVVGSTIESCKPYEFILINNQTIRKEPACESDPKTIVLYDSNGEMLGHYYKLNSIDSAECDEFHYGIEPSSVSVWGKVEKC